MTKASLDIEELLHRAEIQQQQLALKTQFEKNIKYFKTAGPELAEAFLNYQPTKYILQYRNDHWDLLSTATNTYIYNQDPKIFSQDAVARFVRTPFCYRVSLLPSQGFGTAEEAHIGNLNPMLAYIDEAKQKHPEPRKTPIGKDCPALIVNGLGLGYQIESIIQQTCIHHLAIVEPEPDMIYASLHTVDWSSICEEFSNTGRSLNLVLAQTPADGAKQLMSHLSTVGLFNCARTYVFNYLKNDPLQQTIDQFLSLLTTTVAGLGYFDDERVGFAHTVHNIRLGKPLLDFTRAFPKTLSTVPVIVVANGPSLDNAREMLEKNQRNAIIISCGTALGSLYQMGIKPDIHVEMERTRPQLEWVDHSTDAEFRKGILLLTLNTTHPDMFDYFDEAAIALKTNDIGSIYLVERLNRIAYNAHLDRCNPTVGNTGLAFACALGFKSVYIVGLDLGFPESGQHHSKYSVHYRVKEEELKTLDMEIQGSETDVTLPGNFGGNITVTVVYQSAFSNAKKLIAEKPDVTFYNTSEGVFIEGATPTRSTDVILEETEINKTNYISTLLKNYQLPDLTKSIPNDKDIMMQFDAVAITLGNIKNRLKTIPENKSQAWEILQSIHDESLSLKAKSRHGSLHLLIRGSIDAYSLVLARSLYIFADEAEVLAHYKNLLTNVEKFIDHALHSLRNELFKADDRVQELDNKLHKK